MTRKSLRASNIQLVGLGKLGVLLDEFEARLGLVPHQLIDELARAAVVVLCDLDTEQGARGGVHGRLLELLRQHLAETLEARNVDLALAVELRLEERLLVRVVARVERLGALAQAVERRHGAK